MAGPAGADAAEAAAVIIASDGGYDAITTLTASAAPTFEDVAATASELVGRRIGCTVMEPEDWVASQMAAGRPEGMARFTLGMYQAAQDGYFAGIDPLLGVLLGHEPQTVRDMLAQPTA